MLEAYFLQHILEWNYDLAVGAFWWFWFFCNVSSQRSSWRTQRLPLPQTLKYVQLSFENAVNVLGAPIQSVLIWVLLPSALSIHVCSLRLLRVGKKHLKFSKVL